MEKEDEKAFLEEFYEEDAEAYLREVKGVVDDDYRAAFSRSVICSLEHFTKVWVASSPEMHVVVSSLSSQYCREVRCISVLYNENDRLWNVVAITDHSRLEFDTGQWMKEHRDYARHTSFIEWRPAKIFVEENLGGFTDFVKALFQDTELKNAEVLPMRINNGMLKAGRDVIEQKRLKFFNSSTVVLFASMLSSWYETREEVDGPTKIMFTQKTSCDFKMLVAYLGVQNK